MYQNVKYMHHKHTEIMQQWVGHAYIALANKIEFKKGYDRNSRRYCGNLWDFKCIILHHLICLVLKTEAL